MLIKLNLPKRYIQALKLIYGSSTGKGAVDAFISSPIHFEHDDFLSLCHQLDVASVRSVDAVSDPDGEYAKFYTENFPLYTDVVVKAMQTASAFRVEKEIQQ